jgi:two-component system, NtrC family, sensor histidine kinase KinB
MLSDLLPQNWRQKQWVIGVLNGVLLFFMLLAAIYLATQQRDAPQLILILLLYVITVNLTLPPSQGAVGLVPVVSVTSVLILDWQPALLLAAFSLLVAGLAQRLWNPVWDYIDVQRPNLLEHLGRAMVYLLSLAVGAGVYQFTGGEIPPSVGATRDIYSFGFLALAYSATYFLLSFLLWVLRVGSAREFIGKHAVPVLMVTLLAQPFALFGATAFGTGGYPIFVVYCLSVMLIAILLWVNWQQRYILEQQHNQFAILNAVGSSLRETLDLSEVLERTWRTMSILISADRYTVALLDENSGWKHSVQVVRRTAGIELEDAAKKLERDEGNTYAPDDFTRWVIDRGTALDLTTRDMHFAGRHDLVPPVPLPAAWLGVPLRTVNDVIGALVLLRYHPARPFNRWSREVLLAVAGQASAAIQNARLYRETLRLYNRTDQALAERVKQLQALLDTMHEGVLMLDPQGRIVLVNNVAAEMIGRPTNALGHEILNIEEDATKLGHEPERLIQLLEHLQNEHVPQSALFTFETTLENRTHGSSQRFIERMEAPVLAENQQIVGWLMLFRDVTEEQELAAHRRDLTRMIVHDLRNPVTTFISNMHLVDMLLPARAGLEAAREAVKDARQSSYDMLDMVDSLLDINRMEAGQLVVEAEAMNLGTIIERVTNRLGVLAAQRQINLTQQVDQNLPLAWADEDMIRRVLVNLIDNALKYTPSGGYVHCRAMAEPAISKDYEPGVRCIISDTGPGIPEENRDQIFHRFARTNKGGARIRGTGLGLTFCKLAVEAHDGRIWMEPHPAGGSKFFFTLPGIPILLEA